MILLFPCKLGILSSIYEGLRLVFTNFLKEKKKIDLKGTLWHLFFRVLGAHDEMEHIYSKLRRFAV